MHYQPLQKALCLMILLAGTALLGTPRVEAAVTELTVPELTAQSELIVRARVVETTARWNAERTKIVSDVVLKPIYYVTGEHSGPLALEAIGGVIEDEEIAMFSSSAARLRTSWRFCRHAAETSSKPASTPSASAGSRRLRRIRG